MTGTVPGTLPSLFARVVSDRGDHPAIVTRRETLGYRELERRSARLARALLAAGAGKGTRIALLAPDGVFWMVSFLAALRIGALLTPVSTLSTAPELAHCLRHGDVQMLLGARRFLRHDYGATLAAALPGLDKAVAGELWLPAAPYLRAIWLDDDEGLPWAAGIDSLLSLADGPDAPGDALLAAVEETVVASDPAVVIHTSGSTALPKAVVHCHWPLAHHSPVLARHFALRGDDRMMCLLPLFWLAGLSTMLQVLSVGATLVYPDSPAVEDALAMIATAGVTRVNAWGDRQPLLVAAAAAQGIAIDAIPDLSGFRTASGERLPPRAAMYGMTESFSAHSAEPMGVPLPAGKADAFGRAINGYERRVVDPVSGEEVAAGEVGELQIRGPAMMTGFYKRSCQEVFTADGFYPTRDLVRIDGDGFLYPAGRLDDMIKTRGANVSRLEVEAALAALPGVRMAAVAGLPDPLAGKIVVAAVVPERGARLDEQALTAALRRQLSSYKVPRALVFVAEDDIPRTATGKVKIAALVDMIAARLADAQGEQQPGKRSREEQNHVQ